MSRFDQDATWPDSRPDDGNMFPATPGQPWGGAWQTPPGQPPYPPQQPYPPQHPGYPSGGSQAHGSVPPGGRYPGAPYPGWGQPPGRRGLQWWHWVLIAVGSGVLLLCVMCGFLSYAVMQSPSFRAAEATARAMRSPQATFPPQPTFPPPIPTATWDVRITGRMQLGTSAVWNGSEYINVNPQDHFAASDPFVAFVQLDGGRTINSRTAKLSVVTVNSAGTETVVSSSDYYLDHATKMKFAYQSTGSLMSNYPPGTYTYELSVDSAVVAQATFIYTG